MAHRPHEILVPAAACFSSDQYQARTFKYCFGVINGTAVFVDAFVFSVYAAYMKKNEVRTDKGEFAELF